MNGLLGLALHGKFHLTHFRGLSDQRSAPSALAAAQLLPKVLTHSSESEGQASWSFISPHFSLFGPCSVTMDTLEYLQTHQMGNPDIQ